MALPATGIIEIRSTATASNVNGGGFNSARGGTDYTLQDAAQLAITDLSSVLASTTITSATGNFTDAMKGNYIHIASGTNFVAGWYELVTFTDANNYIIDRACTTGGNGSAGVAKVGGAMSMNSTLDDALFEIAIAGNIFWFKGAVTFTMGEAVAIAAAGSTTIPCEIRGYNTTRGDNPAGANRPVIACGANFFGTTVANWDFYNIIITGTAANLLGTSAANKLINCKVINSSTTVDRAAWFINFTDNFSFNSEFISYRGRAINYQDHGLFLDSCYLHDSDIGLRCANAGNANSFQNLIIADNVTDAIIITVAMTSNNIFRNCSLYGAENKLGVGLSLAAGCTDIKLINCIVYGFVTGVTHGTAGQKVSFDDYNCYNNNTTDVSNWTKGSNDVTTNPTFTNVAQLTGSTATTSGSVLTQSGGDFSTVTDNVDFVYIKSGTGVTVGKYMITSHTATTITLDIAPGTNATADKVWQITTGHNFAVGTAIKATGFPGVFQGSLTTGYMDIGAVQRQEPAGGAGGVLVHSGMTGGMHG